MSTEIIRIGNLVIEKTVPDLVEEKSKPEVKPAVRAIAGEDVKESTDLRPGTSARIAKGAPVRPPARR